MRDPITYRYPRTLNEAFGPDADGANPIDREHSDAKVDRPVVITGLLCLVFMAVGSALRWF